MASQQAVFIRLRSVDVMLITLTHSLQFAKPAHAGPVQPVSFYFCVVLVPRALVIVLFLIFPFVQFNFISALLCADARV